uniref:Phosphatidylinositol-binding clathrin assembly protein LAP-like n=1 Tax=Ciona intestinalis TaxID=7719 RepID=F6V4L6_CIOIN|nr:phosphatidylinositol-binding clathrin assembly protein LAP-like [Ciona intestinalis]|eukprot:XP_026693570.1 phosphatidylinositol-binding clathrin assembly protein LAP-like [Ciona intestinalis]
MAGQSISDRFNAAQHTIIGSEMSKSVCKATTTEVMGPKKKHLDYLRSLTNEPNINIPELADMLVERSKQPKWVVVFKSLITTHHLMCYGNEKFLQHLASRNSLFNLTHFLDNSGVQGYDMSTYIRRYSKYLNEKAFSYRTVAYDFTRAKRGKESGVMRSLTSENLIKQLPTIQRQLDALLEFDASPNELTSGVINSAFLLIFKDLIRLFACYNDGIINLLEKYFEMKKAQCKESLDIYKRFLTRMEKVSEMLKVAEQVGIDKGDIPDLTKAPSSLLDALEQHLAAMEGKKSDGKRTGATAAQVSSFNAFNTSLQSIDEKDKQTALAEEEARLNQFKQQKEVEIKTTHPVSSNPPVSFSPPAAQTNPPQQQQQSSLEMDLFGPTPTTFTQSPPQSSLDLFGSLNVQPTQPAMQTNMYGNTGMNLFSQQPTNNSFPQMQQPQATNTTDLFAPMSSDPFSPTGSTMAPTVASIPTQQMNPQSQQIPNNQQTGNGNLETALASAYQNLTLGQRNNPAQMKPEARQLTGGGSYMPTVAPSTMMTPGGYYGAPMMGAQPQMYSARPGGMGMPMNTMGGMGMVRPQGMYTQPPMGYQQPPAQPAQTANQLNPNNPFGPMIQF